jgi:hypothetical protein
MTTKNGLKSGMKWVLAGMLIAQFGGCNSDDGRVSPPDRMPDMVTESGVFIYLEDATIDEMTLVAVSGADYGQDSNELFKTEVEKTWKEVQDCLGLYSDDPPFLIITSENLREWGNARGVKVGSKAGYAFYEENLIVIKNDALPPWRVLRHEFIHTISYQNDMPNFINSSHEPEYLWSCQYDDAYI